MIKLRCLPLFVTASCMVVMGSPPTTSAERDAMVNKRVTTAAPQRGFQTTGTLRGGVSRRLLLLAKVRPQLVDESTTVLMPVVGLSSSGSVASSSGEFCSCGLDTEGQDFCFASGLCGSLTLCAASVDCDPGERCLANNCCAPPEDFACHAVCSGACVGGAVCGTYQECTSSPNDDCLSAERISFGSASGTTVGATSDTVPVCDGILSSAPGVWYAVTGTGNTMIASTCSEFNTNPDTKISVYCGGCDALACAAANDDSCAGVGNSLLSTISWCSQAGVEYFILVHDFSATSGSGAFTLSVGDDGATCDTAPSCGPAVEGDNCDEAVVIQGVPYTTTFDNSTALSGGAPGSCNSGAAADIDNDVWYTYTPTTDCELSVKVDPDVGAEYDGIAAVHEGPDCLSLTELMCLDDPEPMLGNVSVTAGTTYWIQMGDWGTFPGGGLTGLNVDCGLPNGACCDDMTGVCNDNVRSGDCQQPYRFSPGTLCADLSPPCGPPLEACCTTNGNCSDNTSNSCSAAGGTPQGTGTSCATVNCPQPTAACCRPSGCTDETGADCISQSGVWFASETCANFTCPAPPTCPTDTLFGQLPDGPTVSWKFGVADTDWSGGSTQRYESFSALSGPICDLHWWGTGHDTSGRCIENPMTFTIKFYDNAAGASVPGAEMCSYSASVNGIPTGWPYFFGELLEYHLDFPTCCDIRDGWVSLQATGGTDCWFWWLSSSDGDGKSCFQNDGTLDCSGADSETNYDLSLCLTGAPDPLGACCVDGTCAGLMTEQQCFAQTGSWSQGEDCANFVCPQACCLSNHDCGDVPPDVCRSNYGIPRGPGTNCDTNPCPQTPQACCFADVTCRAVLTGSCTAACTCNPDMNCDGALDASDIEPFKTAMTDRVTYQNTFPFCDLDWADVDCDGDIDELDGHAFNCLLGIGGPTECMSIDAPSCTSHGGTPVGPGTACSNTQEACCSSSNGACLNRDPVCCTAARGSAQGPGTVCGELAVACCFDDGSCSELDPQCCDEMGGRPSPISEPVCLQDNNNDGVDDACENPPTGACCDRATGVCNDNVLAIDCAGTQQTWHQDLPCNDPNVSCAPLLQACCLPDGTCLDLTADDCQEEGGFPQGSSCDIVICQPISCEESPFPACGGSCPAGLQCIPSPFSGICYCEPVPCEQSLFPACGGDCPPGAVCEAGNLSLECACIRLGVCCVDGDCIDDQTQTDCDRLQGQWSADMACADFICSEACCFHDGSCTDVPPQVCVEQGSIPIGPGSACASVDCPRPIIEVDQFDFSIGHFDLAFPDGSIKTMTVGGPATVNVYFEGANEGDANDSDGDTRDDVVTEMVALNLAGYHPDLGVVVVGVHPTIPSLGEIEELVNNNPGLLDVDPFAPGDADSFFDIFFELKVNGRVLVTDVPTRIDGTLTNKPAALGDVYDRLDTSLLQLFDTDTGELSGFALGSIRYWPRPAGACCIDGVCIEGETQDSCEELGGSWFSEQTCEDVVCLEACCFPDGSCYDLPPNVCNDQGGITAGAGSDCSGVKCEPIRCEQSVLPICGGVCPVENHCEAVGADLVVLPSPLLPPESEPQDCNNILSMYESENVHTLFPGGVDLSNAIHKCFHNVQRQDDGSGNEIETFDSIVEVSVDLGGGPVPVTLTGPMVVVVYGKTGNTTGTFQTEIVSMSLTGDVGGIPVEIRESPSLASTGQTTITDLGGGLWQIDSFFDVFTELSVSGGPFQPQTNEPRRMTLVSVEPSGCECVPDEVRCDQSDPDMCNGVCPTPGDVCTHNPSGGPCFCEPLDVLCEQSFPACGGECPPDMVCTESPAGGSCTCQPVSEACCLSNTECIDVPPDECRQLDGVSRGPGTNCELPGDLDGSGDVSNSDWALFAPCMDGPTTPAGTVCARADPNCDGVVDLRDAQIFQVLFGH